MIVLVLSKDAEVRLTLQVVSLLCPNRATLTCVQDRKDRCDYPRNYHKNSCRISNGRSGTFPTRPQKYCDKSSSLVMRTGGKNSAIGQKQTDNKSTQK